MTLSDTRDILATPPGAPPGGKVSSRSRCGPTRGCGFAALLASFPVLPCSSLPSAPSSAPSLAKLSFSPIPGKPDKIPGEESLLWKDTARCSQGTNPERLQQVRSPGTRSSNSPSPGGSGAL